MIKLQKIAEKHNLRTDRKNDMESCMRGAQSASDHSWSWSSKLGKRTSLENTKISRTRSSPCQTRRKRIYVSGNTASEMKV